MKDRKTELSREMGETHRREAVSMGAAVKMEDVCPLCERGESHEHRDPEDPNRIHLVGPPPTFLYATMVKAPTCRACGVRMAVHEDRDWVCLDSACEASGFVVPAHLTGVYPAKLLR